MTCESKGCTMLATHCFTWPGGLAQCHCAVHAEEARRIAHAKGFELQVYPVVGEARELHDRVHRLEGHNARLEQRLDEQDKALATLHAATERLRRCLDLMDALRHADDTLVTVTGEDE